MFFIPNQECLVPALILPDFIPLRNNRGHSRTSRSMYSTANHFASTTTTRRTTHSALHLDADCPLRGPALSPTTGIGTTQPTFCANSSVDKVARPNLMANTGSSTDCGSATAMHASIQRGARTSTRVSMTMKRRTIVSKCATRLLALVPMGVLVVGLTVGGRTERLLVKDGRRGGLRG